MNSSAPCGITWMMSSSPEWSAPGSSTPFYGVGVIEFEDDAAGVGAVRGLQGFEGGVAGSNCRNNSSSVSKNMSMRTFSHRDEGSATPCAPTSSVSKWLKTSLAGIVITDLPHLRSLFPQTGQQPGIMAVDDSWSGREPCRAQMRRNLGAASTAALFRGPSVGWLNVSFSEADCTDLPVISGVVQTTCEHGLLDTPSH